MLSILNWFGRIRHVTKRVWSKVSSSDLKSYWVILLCLVMNKENELKIYLESILKI